MAVLESKYEAMQMWTLTIDPTLFASPEDAFEYVRKHRCVSEWVRTLRAKGYLTSGDYFCVVEWQKDTEMPHFHVLLNTRFIDWEVALKRWGDFRPDGAGPVEGNRPGFGTVLFSEGNFENKLHAARYACAYLLKNPEHGYPAYVLDMRREVKRYQTSKGFWKLGDEVACEQVEPVADVVDESEEVADETKTSIRERIAKCASETVVLRVEHDATSEAAGKARLSFVRKIGLPFADVMQRLGIDPEFRGAISVTSAELLDLNYAASRKRTPLEPWDLGGDQATYCANTSEQEDRAA
ncbi:MAG: hypothetical protein QM775_08225 [Pirellulales bacterium]